MSIIDIIKAFFNKIINNNKKDYYLEEGKSDSYNLDLDMDIDFESENDRQEDFNEESIVISGSTIEGAIIGSGAGNRMIINGKDVTREAINKGKNMKTKERRYGDDLEEELKKEIQMAQVEIGRKYREMEKDKENNYITHQEIEDENGDHIVINNSSIDENTIIGGSANVMSNNRSMSQENER